MKKPKIHPLNYEEVYNFYDTFYNAEFAVKMHRLFGAVFKPEFHWLPDAEQSKFEVAAHLEEGNPIAFAFNHVNLHDQNYIAAVMQNDPTLKASTGNSLIWSKSGPFQVKGLRRFIEGVGAMPVFRRKDFPEIEGLDEEQRQQLFDRTTDALIDTTVSRINRGQNFGSLPEGTRNRGDLRKIQEVQEGIGRICIGVDDETNLGILPISFVYPENYSIYKKLRSPVAAIGHLMAGPYGDDTGVIARSVQENMQEALNFAWFIADSK